MNSYDTRFILKLKAFRQKTPYSLVAHLFALSLMPTLTSCATPQTSLPEWTRNDPSFQQCANQRNTALSKFSPETSQKCVAQAWAAIPDDVKSCMSRIRISPQPADMRYILPSDPQIRPKIAPCEEDYQEKLELGNQARQAQQKQQQVIRPDESQLVKTSPSVGRIYELFPTLLNEPVDYGFNVWHFLACLDHNDDFEHVAVNHTSAGTTISGRYKEQRLELDFIDMGRGLQVVQGDVGSATLTELGAQELLVTLESKCPNFRSQTPLPKMSK